MEDSKNDWDFLQRSQVFFMEFLLQKAPPALLLYFVFGCLDVSLDQFFSEVLKTECHVS